MIVKLIIGIAVTLAVAAVLAIAVFILAIYQGWNDDD